MKHFALFTFLDTLPLSLVTRTAAVSSTESAKSIFDKSWREDRVLQKGKNIRLSSDQTASSVLQKVQSKVKENTFNFHFVGIALNVRNQSPFKLAEPKVYQRCGYQVSIVFRKNRKDFKYYFLISGGRDLSGRLQRACECQS